MENTTVTLSTSAADSIICTVASALFAKGETIIYEKFKALFYFFTDSKTDLRYRHLHYEAAWFKIYIYFGGLKKVQKVGKFCESQSKSDRHLGLLKFEKASFSMVKSRIGLF